MIWLAGDNSPDR